MSYAKLFQETNIARDAGIVAVDEGVQYRGKADACAPPSDSTSLDMTEIDSKPASNDALVALTIKTNDAQYRVNEIGCPQTNRESSSRVNYRTIPSLFGSIRSFISQSAVYIDGIFRTSHNSRPSSGYSQLRDDNNSDDDNTYVQIDSTDGNSLYDDTAINAEPAETAEPDEPDEPDEPAHTKLTRNRECTHRCQRILLIVLWLTSIIVTIILTCLVTQSFQSTKGMSSYLEIEPLHFLRGGGIIIYRLRMSKIKCTILE